MDGDAPPPMPVKPSYSERHVIPVDADDGAGGGDGVVNGDELKLPNLAKHMLGDEAREADAFLQEEPSPGGGADRHSGQVDYEYHEVEQTIFVAS